MGRFSSLSILLLSLLIALCFTNGFGRKMRILEAVDSSSHHASRVQLKEIGGKWRRMMMMMETMDYPDPQPNTNIKGGIVPPPPPPTPTHV